MPLLAIKQASNPLMPHSNTDSTHQRRVFSVSELNNSAKYLLEDAFPAVWLEGEISNLVRPRSGHLYLTLKDDNAQLRAAMFRGNNVRLTFNPKDGMSVLVRGRLSLFAPRGDYQLIIDQMEEAGLGALQRAYEALKQKLETEGLFDDNKKLAIPTRPNVIGVVTSPTGAAIHDILSVFKRRFPLTRIIIYPTLVQGAEAPAQICQAINHANQRNECDVLIVGRGGGSLEDLWCFNDEQVARAIANSNLPIVSAVGHQVDFTIADFVADLRAPTPSAAAELLSDNAHELSATFGAYQQALSEHIHRTLRQKAQQLLWISKRLKHPGKKLEEHSQRLDELELRLKQTIRNQIAYHKSTLKTAQAQLISQTPAHTITQHQTHIKTLNKILNRAMEYQLKQAKFSSAALVQRLHSVSPLNTLARGYSITKDVKGNILHTPDEKMVGETIVSQLHHGELTATVTHISHKK